MEDLHLHSLLRRPSLAFLPGITACPLAILFNAFQSFNCYFTFDQLVMTGDDLMAVELYIVEEKSLEIIFRNILPCYGMFQKFSIINRTF